MLETHRAIISSGTLIIAVPTVDGLVFAADSREVLHAGSSRERIICDSQYKIRIPSLPFRTAFAITGYGLGYPPLPPDCTQSEDTLRFIRASKPVFDIRSDLKRWLEASQCEVLTVRLLENLREKCIQALKSVPSSFIRQFRGLDVFQVVIGSYMPDSKIGVIANWSTHIGRFWGRVSATDITWNEVGQSSARTYFRYGATDYVETNVVRPPASIFMSRLPPRTATIFSTNGAVCDTLASDAVEWAQALIDSTAVSMFMIADEESVGGPVDAVLLGSSREPVLLRWKTPPISA